MLIPAFQLHLGHPILRGLATIGKYDGKHPCLTFATSGGKVVVHSPHEIAKDGEESTQIRFLNMSKQITGMTTGALLPGHSEDILIIGTPTAIQSYNVEENTDVFYRDVADGCMALCFGVVGDIHRPLAIVGGNCSIQGFNEEGEELFWTVTGDNVTTMTLIDVDEDGIQELLVGSEDFHIRIFQNEEVISETEETDEVTGLCPIRRTKYGYSLANGTVGVYDRSRRVWRVKSRQKATAIEGFDLDGDGIPELVSGWSNGKLEVRSEDRGELVYRDKMEAPISGIVKADYRMDGTEHIMFCAEDGEVRGFIPAEEELKVRKKTAAYYDDGKAFSELGKRKEELLMQLQMLDQTMEKMKTVVDDDESAVPSDTTITCTLSPNPSKKCVEMTLKTNTTAVIRCVSITADGIFPGSSFVWSGVPDRKVVIPLPIQKNLSADMKIESFVGARMGKTFPVLQQSAELPKFSMFAETDASEMPVSYVTFSCSERPQRLFLWLKSSFIYHKVSNGHTTIDGRFRCVRTGKMLRIQRTEEDGGRIRIHIDDMQTAAELVEDLVEFFQLSDLESEVSFPEEMELFKQTLVRVDELNAARMQMSAGMADNVQLVKTMLIQGEDSRLLGDMSRMRKHYAELMHVNRDLLGEYHKRSTNHEALLKGLKEVNRMIQLASRLRGGSVKSRIVSSSRAAIKENRIHDLLKIIVSGRE